ncbi:DUF1015 domain-containing protein [Chloroflexota bacterium]
MSNVQPFRGLRYNVERIGDISSVISPPYDVISPEEQGLFHGKSPYNVVRLELGEDRPTDSPDKSNKYTRAGDTFRNWLKEGVLIREPVPAFYVLQHCFMQQGIPKSRWGLVARVRLAEESAGGTRPHEVILESRVRDRLNLLHSCPVNISSIMGMVHSEGDGLLSLIAGFAKGTPHLSAVDQQGVTHNMWVVTDGPSLEQISASCADKVIYIADGHHRYETALAHRREQQNASPNNGRDDAYNFVMMALTDVGDPGMVALSAHRLVRLPLYEGLGGLVERLSPLFNLEYLEPSGVSLSDRLKAWLDTLGDRGREALAIGVYGLSEKRLCLLTLRNKSKIRDLLPSKRSEVWKNLDVSILHWVIFRHMMGIDTPQKEEECIKYVRDEEEAINRVDSEECQLAFLMNPVPLSSVLAVADAGDRMPPKSTYFYPKLPTGLVMNPLWDDE